MHVLTLTPFYPTANDDALGCFIAEPIAELLRLGVDSTVLAVYPRHKSIPVLNPHALAAESLSYFSLPGNSGLSTAGNFLYSALKSRVSQIHAQNPIQVIHAHAALPCGYAAMLLSRDLKIPFVVTVHGLDVFYREQVPFLFKSSCAARAQAVYEAAARVVCISNRVAEPIRNASKGRCKMSIIYNGVDPEKFHPAPNPLTSEAILSVGNLIPIKGHGDLLTGIAALKSEFPNVQCRIVGDGPEKERLQALANNLGLAGRVQFLGKLSRAAVSEAMRECTVFALPSRYEGLGCVYLEAMASCLPTIGCRGQGIEEVIRNGENGWLVDPGDSSGIAAALCTCLTDESTKLKIGQAARATILDGFTLRHQAEKLSALYQECIR